MSRPLAIDLYCGLGGWTAGLLAAGYDVIGFDIERHEYDGERYAAQLVLQDVRTLHGSQFRDATLIVASPPCQEFSYMAMPWSRAKQIARALRGEDEFPSGYRGSRTLGHLTELFDTCFRIQREACQAAGRHIPLVVENVRGAEPWVSRAAWSFGSYYLWGDVPALMPVRVGGVKVSSVGASRRTAPGNGARFTSIEPAEGRKNPGFRFDGSGRSFQSESVARHVAEGRKGSGSGDAWWRNPDNPSMLPSSSPRRKAASARIAKIPFALSNWIARTYLPAAEIAA